MPDSSQGGNTAVIDLARLPPPPPVHDRGAPIDDDVEIDLTVSPARVVRKQYPKLEHPWAENWPTWSSL